MVSYTVKFDRRLIQADLRAIQRIKTWQLVVLLVLALFVSAIFLRLNNVGMIERRNAVYAADKVGDAEQIRERLYDLQRYAANHMNAPTGEVYLDKKYERDTDELIRELQANSDEDSAYTKADRICRPRYVQDGFYSTAYMLCIKEETSKRSSGSEVITEIKAPDPSLYRFEFFSPLWSFDFAGVSVLITGLIALVIIIRAVVTGVLKLLLKQQYRSI